jgi:hypothetical protein
MPVGFRCTHTTISLCSLYRVYILVLLCALLWIVCYTMFALCFVDLLSEGVPAIIIAEVLSYAVLVADIPLQRVFEYFSV